MQGGRERRVRGCEGGNGGRERGENDLQGRERRTFEVIISLKVDAFIDTSDCYVLPLQEPGPLKLSDACYSPLSKHHRSHPANL